MAMNAMFVLHPYKLNGTTWVFDDPAVGLVKEPFVLGIDKMLDLATAEIPNAQAGFRLLFSPNAFPGYALKLEWRREESGGNWYWCESLKIEGWLCPALFKYFPDKAPLTLFAKPEPKA